MKIWNENSDKKTLQNLEFFMRETHVQMIPILFTVILIHMLRPLLHKSKQSKSIGCNRSIATAIEQHCGNWSNISVGELLFFSWFHKPPSQSAPILNRTELNLNATCEVLIEFVKPHWEFHHVNWNQSIKYSSKSFYGRCFLVNLNSPKI